MPRSPRPEDAIEDRVVRVHAYLDGELDVFNSSAISRQIANDPSLRAEVERIEALRSAIREKLPLEPVPGHVKAKIDRTIGPSRKVESPSWRALAASVMLGMVLASGSTWFFLRPLSEDRLGQSVVDGHMRALLAGQVTNVASSDRHTVKPWFNGRLPQSPQVADLAQEGFPLVGGRIDVVDGTPVPTLVYGRRSHVISLMALPSSGFERESSRNSIKGYNLINWRDGDVHYWAASDLNAAELETFARSFRTALTAH
jgi:anti-sigma factor RsiW